MKKCEECGQLFDVSKNSLYRLCKLCYIKEYEEQADIHEDYGDRD